LLYVNEKSSWNMAYQYDMVKALVLTQSIGFTSSSCMMQNGLQQSQEALHHIPILKRKTIVLIYCNHTFENPGIHSKRTT
jgi:hypothetical protein